jgi:hypothetical protein
MGEDLPLGDLDRRPSAQRGFDVLAKTLSDFVDAVDDERGVAVASRVAGSSRVC